MIGSYELATLLFVLATLAVWHSKTLVWQCSLGAAVAASLFTGSLAILSLVPILALIALLIGYRRQDKLWWVYFSGLLVLGLAYGLHILPGFNNQEFVQSYKLSESSAALSIWFNYDKSLFGILVLGLIFHDRLIRSWNELTACLRRLIPIACVGIPVVYGLAVLTGYARPDVTLSAVFLPWALKNLFFTVIAEEIMFRGLIQRELIARIKSQYAAAIGIGLAGLLFGLAHFAGGPGYVFLSTIAGCLYGYAYYATRRIEAAFIIHFLLNAGHFLFFSYPYFVAH